MNGLVTFQPLWARLRKAFMSNIPQQPVWLKCDDLNFVLQFISGGKAFFFSLFFDTCPAFVYF